MRMSFFYFRRSRIHLVIVDWVRVLNSNYFKSTLSIYACVLNMSVENRYTYHFWLYLIIGNGVHLVNDGVHGLYGFSIFGLKRFVYRKQNSQKTSYLARVKVSTPFRFIPVNKVDFNGFRILLLHVFLSSVSEPFVRLNM